MQRNKAKQKANQEKCVGQGDFHHYLVRGGRNNNKVPRGIQYHQEFTTTPVSVGHVVLPVGCQVGRKREKQASLVRQNNKLIRDTLTRRHSEPKQKKKKPDKKMGKDISTSTDPIPVDSATSTSEFIHLNYNYAREEDEEEIIPKNDAEFPNEDEIEEDKIEEDDIEEMDTERPEEMGVVSSVVSSLLDPLITAISSQFAQNNGGNIIVSDDDVPKRPSRIPRPIKNKDSENIKNFGYYKAAQAQPQGTKISTPHQAQDQTDKEEEDNSLVVEDTVQKFHYVAVVKPKQKETKPEEEPRLSIKETISKPKLELKKKSTSYVKDGKTIRKFQSDQLQLNLPTNEELIITPPPKKKESVIGPVVAQKETIIKPSPKTNESIHPLPTVPSQNSPLSSKDKKSIIVKPKDSEIKKDSMSSLPNIITTKRSRSLSPIPRVSVTASTPQQQRIPVSGPSKSQVSPKQENISHTDSNKYIKDGHAIQKFETPVPKTENTSSFTEIKTRKGY